MADLEIKEIQLQDGSWRFIPFLAIQSTILGKTKVIGLALPQHTYAEALALGDMKHCQLKEGTWRRKKDGPTEN